MNPNDPYVDPYAPEPEDYAEAPTEQYDEPFIAWDASSSTAPHAEWSNTTWDPVPGSDYSTESDPQSSDGEVILDWHANLPAKIYQEDRSVYLVDDPTGIAIWFTLGATIGVLGSACVWAIFELLVLALSM